MSFQGYQVGGAGQFTVFPSPVNSPRDPTTLDIVSADGAPYLPGQEWVNTTSHEIFTYAGAGVWSDSTVQAASETVAGIVRLATVAETLAGTSNTIATTPLGVAAIAIAGAPLASDTTPGLTELATDAEAVSRSAAPPYLVVTPANLTAVLAAPGPIGNVTPSTGAFTTIAGTSITGLTTPLSVPQGGSGAATFTDHGILLGSGVTAFTATAVGTNNQLLIGQTAADPIWSDNIDIPGTLDVTGAATFDNNLTVAGTFTVATLNISGALTVSGLITGNASLTVATAGTALTLGSDNNNAAIVVGSGTTARAINIGTSAAAHTISLGSASAGAITVDTAAGISLDAATASNFTVTGAAVDLTLSSSGGSVNVLASQAAADAIVLNASNAAGGVQIQAGTGGILIGNEADTSPISVGDIAPTASRTITVGGGTVVTAAVTDTIDIGPDGATTNANSVKTVNINTGGVTTGQVLTNIASGAVTSGTHTTAIASGNRAAGTMALNLMTGTGTKIANLGNADAGTTFNIDAVTLINDSVNANTSINTGSSTGLVTIGNALAGAVALASGAAITADTTANISLDSATASNFTVTGAGADLTLSSVGGSVLVESTENAALAIRLHANGGTSETIQLHSDQGTGVGSINLLSDVGGITLTATGLATADAINLEATAGGIDADAALQINITSSQDAADAIRILASAGGIDIDAVGAAAQDITITNTGGSVSVVATEAVADAIVLNASNASGGIDILTGGGEITISSTGNVAMVPATNTVAGTSLAINARVGVATYTGLTTAAGANEDLTITNSTVGVGSGVFVTVSNTGTNDADMTLEGVITQTAGTILVHTQNNGPAALNGNIIVTFWVIN